MQVDKFVESYFDAWNRHDAQRVADHLCEDGIYLDVPENAQSSHDDLIDYLGEFFAYNHDRYELIGDILTDGRSLGFQYRYTVSEPGGSHELPASFCGAEFMTLRGDAAIRITDYYDRGPRERSVPDPGAAGRSKYAKSGLSVEQLRRYKSRLERLMSAEQLFLRADLTLPALADAVGCSVNHLSQVINAGFGMSFFDYMNRYRVIYAKQLLATRDDRNSAILNIAFSAGFNSNSAFYAAFKKYVGQTPAQYRRSNRSGRRDPGC